VPETTPSTGLRNPELLGIYCNDHLASATGGIELVSRMLGTHKGDRFEQPLEQLLSELREEKAAYLRIMADLGIPVRQYKQLAGWMGEKVARFKLNGHLLSRSPLSDLVEFEFMASGVRAKRSGFETLRIAAEADPRLPKDELDRLIDQAHRQYQWLTGTRREVAGEIFGGSPEVADRSGEA
jgi:hypothetical protein